MDPNLDLVRATFYITYVLLMTTTTITLIEALRTRDIKVRHMLNLETCISIVALFFYGQFIQQLNAASGGPLTAATGAPPAIDFKSMTATRYTDWLITTTMMLLVLVLFASYHSGRDVSAALYLVVVALNVVMLATGYLGETGRMDRRAAAAAGFLAFGALFGFVWYHFFRGLRRSPAAHVLFWLYAVVWALYGVVYNWDDVAKNVSYNVLDLISKVLVGLGSWANTSGVLVA